MDRIFSSGVGRILAFVGIVITLILVVAGKMAILWTGVLFLLAFAAILL